MHPRLWPRAKKKNCECCDVGDVPKYHQIIIGSGETDIGLHMDNAAKPPHLSKTLYDMVDMKDSQYNTKACDEDNSAHVDTWVTISRFSLLISSPVLQFPGPHPPAYTALILRE